ncbi:MAG: methylenetetrahydrofolate reductase C-terminal domain-containing protein [Candidatus Omnitrophica bacterium]|nr:methylenetetrahydrofolate reductase C-terminal domain-containing protein [Candidatus Omnitrophota bacterium]
MNITEQKLFRDILASLEPYRAVFLVGCGDCSTVCKTGGSDQVLHMARLLEERGKTVTGFCVPQAPCIASHIKTEFAKNMKQLREADVMLVLACGAGVQSAKDNDRSGKTVIPACNTLFTGVMDAAGNFKEKCSLCGECVLEITGGICPITLCSKGLMNGPCGGMDKGKCETDRNKDCAWVLIYQELEKRGIADKVKQVQKPRDYKKMQKPRSLSMK